MADKVTKAEIQRLLEGSGYEMTTSLVKEGVRLSRWPLPIWSVLVSIQVEEYSTRHVRTSTIINLLEGKGYTVSPFQSDRVLTNTLKVMRGGN